MDEQAINFYTEDVDFQVQEVEKTTAWIEQAIQEEGGKLSFINFIFCSDTYLHTINLEHLNHDTYTDIITFPYSKTELESDIFISIDRVRENAATFEVDFEQELHRVMIHGVLHLLGQGDKSAAEKKEMRAKEDFWLGRIK